MKPRTVTLYGIVNCDSVKKARARLAPAGVELEFHDFRKAGLSDELLTEWLAVHPWQTLLNRRGTSWRSLDAAAQHAVVDDVSARAAMLRQSSLVKRPVIVWPDGAVTIGLEALDARLA